MTPAMRDSWERRAPQEPRIAPSLLAADWANFGRDAAACAAAGAPWLHFDFMDGCYVPNLTFGVPLVKALRKASDAFFDVHLMVQRPDDLVEELADAGADAITVHVEAVVHLQRTLAMIRKCGCRAGVALNPATPPETLAYVLDDLDLVLVMTVNPGFGGQSFLPAAGRKVADLDRLRERSGARFLISVDGGVDPQTAPGLVRGGADALVAGSFVFGHPGGVDGGVAALRAALGS